MNWTTAKPSAAAESAKSRHLAPWSWPDVLAITVLALCAAVGSWVGAQSLDPILLDWDIRDVWFGSDIARVYSSMTDRWGPHFRTYVHPLFPLLTAPPVYALRRLFDVGTLAAVRTVIAVTAAVWLTVIFVIFRLVGLRRADAALFSLVAGSSAAALFWLTVPETYVFGSVSMLVALLLAAVNDVRPVSSGWYVVGSALTLSYTVTNWMAGILATAAAFPWRRALQVTVNVFCLVVVLWAIQKFLFPSVQFFLVPDSEEKHFIFNRDSGGPLSILRSFFLYSMAMPAIQYLNQVDVPSIQWLMLRVQPSGLSSLTPWGLVAVACWAALLALGTVEWLTMRHHRGFKTVLALLVAGQLLLHLLYGEETFLYSLHFLPLLVLWAGLSTLTRARGVAMALGAVLVLSAGFNNVLRFQEAQAFVATHGTERHQVKRAMHLRPQDPWPRGMGHVVLAWPGSEESEKGYHEPGGSFSPGVGTFGLSLWMTDRMGRLEATSDSIRLEDVHQEFFWQKGSALPGIRTITAFYEADWTVASPTRWHLRLLPRAKDGRGLQLVVRGVGPAAGPVTSLRWHDGQLLINDRWRLRFEPALTTVFMGEEGEAGWMSATPASTQWTSNDGWGYARVPLPAISAIRLTVEDTATHADGPERLQLVHDPIQLELPDPHFVSSLNAQVAHLLMGTVGSETRPADPIDFPLAWQRDAAYIIVALARAGQLPAARQLAIQLAEQDFFGGFGPEADAPALAIWALEELATQLQSQSDDRWFWPHVRRKAEWIVAMSQTDRPLHAQARGLVWYRLDNNPERTLVAEPARDGLIIGRADNHRPVLYVNALSHRGLLRAASLADRLGQRNDAERWRQTARALAASLTVSPRPSDLTDDRTYTVSFWPAAVPERAMPRIHHYLNLRWSERREPDGSFRARPFWPAFELGEAHQWLSLGYKDRTWKTVQWFWQHQASPGLYTWWEGDGPPISEWKDATHRGRYSFQGWRQVRGWTDPPHTTPHYWAAAQMLLLQLDMLTSIDRSFDPPRIILGAGLPDAWLDRPLRVHGIPVPGGLLDWSWDGHEVQAVVASRTTGRPMPLELQLGSSFPAQTPLRIERRIPGRLRP